MTSSEVANTWSSSDSASQVLTQTTASKSGWTVHILRNAAKDLTTARLTGLAIGGLGGMLLALGVLAGIALRARQRTIAARREAARAELEQQVNVRTSELSLANARLVQEVDERAREMVAQRQYANLSHAATLTVEWCKQPDRPDTSPLRCAAPAPARRPAASRSSFSKRRPRPSSRPTPGSAP